MLSDTPLHGDFGATPGHHGEPLQDSRVGMKGLFNSPGPASAVGGCVGMRSADAWCMHAVHVSQGTQLPATQHAFGSSTQLPATQHAFGSRAQLPATQHAFGSRAHSYQQHSMHVVRQLVVNCL